MAAVVEVRPGFTDAGPAADGPSVLPEVVLRITGHGSPSGPVVAGARPGVLPASSENAAARVPAAIGLGVEDGALGRPTPPIVGPGQADLTDGEGIRVMPRIP